MTNQVETCDGERRPGPESQGSHRRVRGRWHLGPRRLPKKVGYPREALGEVAVGWVEHSGHLLSAAKAALAVSDGCFS